jgi:hypothetical protein
MYHRDFTDKIISIIKDDPNILGLAAGGSWITNEIDEFSDLDLVIVTENKIGGDKGQMQAFAENIGSLLNSFTGEHVGEPRLLICLYKNPLLHVDMKFVTPLELLIRVEDPIILFERNNTLSEIMATTKPTWPFRGYQWMEDRFWTWIHYMSQKLGRGEYFEVLDGLTYLRMHVFAPLLQLKNNLLPRGVRKVEMQLSVDELRELAGTIAAYDRKSIAISMENSIALYRSLRKQLFPGDIILAVETEQKCCEYFHFIVSNA